MDEFICVYGVTTTESSHHAKAMDRLARRRAFMGTAVMDDITVTVVVVG